MTQETLKMSQKERRRQQVLGQMETGVLSLQDAAERMGLCYRQAKRVWKRYRQDGAEGLVHRSRDRISNRRSDPALKARAVGLYKQLYPDFGPTLAAEKLAEIHGLAVNRETLRRWLKGACLWAGRRKERAHRKCRPRRTHFGELVQLDGSEHRWFEDRADPCCLMVMVDDATGKTHAHLGAEETTRNAFLVLRKWILSHGVPSAIYTDRKSVYYVDREPTEEEKRQGSGPLTDFGRACWRLGIEMIWANSPQAKGRVERKNGVFQDRLVKELRLRGISDMESANAVLDPFTASLDEKFARPAAGCANHHRALPAGTALEDILCWEETRRVQNDWTVSYGGQFHQILRQKGMPAAKARVTIRRGMDGSLAILHEGRELRFEAIRRALARRKGRAVSYQPRSNQPPMGGGEGGGKGA